MDFVKLAAQGALGAAAGLMALWLGFLFVTRPGSTGGFDSTLHLCLGAATLVLFGWLALAHVWMGLQLKNGPQSIRG